MLSEFSEGGNFSGEISDTDQVEAKFEMIQVYFGTSCDTNALLFNFFAALLIAGLSLHHIFQKRRSLKPFENIPMAPGAHFLTGHYPSFAAMKGDFRRSQSEIYAKHCNEDGQVGIWLGPQPVLVLKNWTDARVVLNSEHERSRLVLMRKHMAMFLGQRNITVLGGREWRVHRTFINKSLRQTVVEKSRTIIKGVTNKLVDAILRIHLPLGINGEGVVMNVESLTKMMTMDVFGKVAFSADFNYCSRLEPGEVGACFDVLSTQFTERALRPLNPLNWFYNLPTKRNREHREARMYLRTFVQKRVAEKIGRQSSQPTDILDHLIAAHEEMCSEAKHKHAVNDPFELTNETGHEALLSDSVLTILFAGYDTTSTTLAYALYLIARHPEISRLCREEVDALSHVKSDECLDFPFCRGVILETLRLYPPAPMVNRTLRRSIKLSGNRVAKAGTQIFVPIWLIHHDEQIWPSPKSFRPDRWVRQRTKEELRASKLNPSPEEGNAGWVYREETDVTTSDIAPANRMALLSFSCGGRSCPGRNFAIEEAMLGLVGLVKRLDFSTIPGHTLKPRRRGVVQSPEGGIPLRIRRRVDR